MKSSPSKTLAFHSCVPAGPPYGLLGPTGAPGYTTYAVDDYIYIYTHVQYIYILYSCTYIIIHIDIRNKISYHIYIYTYIYIYMNIYILFIYIYYIDHIYIVIYISHYIIINTPGEVGISAEQIDGLEGLGYVGSPPRRVGRLERWMKRWFNGDHMVKIMHFMGRLYELWVYRDLNYRFFF